MPDRLEHALARPSLRERAAAVARWAATHDGAATAADELERWAARVGPT